MRTATLFASLLLVVVSCADDDGRAAAEGMTVAAMVASAAPGDSVEFSGEVSLLGELFCPCFEVTSGNESVIVWYDLMVDDDVSRPPVDVSGISNGDILTVEGICQDDPDPGSGLMVVWASAVRGK